jgi:hypothetical protein
VQQEYSSNYISPKVKGDISDDDSVNSHLTGAEQVRERAACCGRGNGQQGQGRGKGLGQEEEKGCGKNDKGGGRGTGKPTKSGNTKHQMYRP